MIAIWKFELDIVDNQLIKMPMQMTTMSVAEQYGKLCLWAIGETEGEIKTTHIKIVGTGNPTDVKTLYADLIGTVVMKNGLVWHVFDMGDA